jgi:hypothetical protein
MGRSSGLRLLAAVAVVVCCADPAAAQYFGRNKVQYDRDHVRVLATDHFDIYYESEDGDAAIIAGRLAERWYARLSKALDHTLGARQPLILYGSHRRFEQTNVLSGSIDENTGGFTEARKRRIVVPFSVSLAETDHVLGHEIVHAFQYDISARYKTYLSVSLWFVEGMAEYLSLGPDDPLTSMWMRDAVRAEKLPSIRDLSSPRLFPYRWGAALWMYLVDRFGADLPAKALRQRKDALTRIQQLTGESADALTRGWHESLRSRYGDGGNAGSEAGRPLISSKQGGGRLNLGASISPDGRRMVFLSERDQFSIDLFLADAAGGVVTRKLITTAGNRGFESLQYLHSAGAWDPAGRRFALAMVRAGRPALAVIDIDGGRGIRQIPLPTLDEAYSPTWAPDGHAIAFSGLNRGVTDLYTVDLSTGDVRRLTHDAYADLQPAWSPDGRRIAFTTDRFSTDLTMLRFGAYRLGVLDVASGAIGPAPTLGDGSQFDPAWSPDGSSLYFVGERGGITNVFRTTLTTGDMFQMTQVPTGVSGVTRLSPALSVASATGAVTYSIFRRGGYEIHVLPPSADLRADGERVDVLADSSFDARDGRAAVADEPELIAPVPPLPSPGSPNVVPPGELRYRPKLSLEAIGSPYFSAGGGSFGGSVQAGASLLFGDLLGDRRLLAAVHISSRLNESALGLIYLNRTTRWNWGLTAEQAPEMRLRSSGLRLDSAGGQTATRTRERQVWTHRTAGGFIAYPLNRSQRIELSAGVRHISFDREIQTQVISLEPAKLLEQRVEHSSDQPSVGMAEVGAALIADSTVFGATGPLIGSRYRIQMTPAVGGLTYTRLLTDYRRYMMPVRPYTIALRIVHSQRLGPDADDDRLRELYVGSSTLVRGYGAAAVIRSECGGSASNCPAVNALFGTGVLVAKAELRVPVMGAFSSRVKYGPVPVDAFAFADAGRAWGGHQELFGPGRSKSIIVRSVGAGVRVNAMGLILELATVKPLDLKRRGWSFGFNLRPGF